MVQPATPKVQAAILVNGRIVKSINQWYNKRPCKSRLRKRYWRLENYFHHVSKFVVDLCVKEGIGRIIIGRNEGWKQNINLGKKTIGLKVIPEFCGIGDRSLAARPVVINPLKA